MKEILALIKKEFIQFRRTKAMIGITIAMPIIQLLILGFALSGDVVQVPTAITDLDNTQLSRDIVSKLENTQYLDVQFRLNDVRGETRLLERGDVILSVIIPHDFQKNAVRGNNAVISITADAQNTNVVLTGTGYVRRIILSWAQSRGLTAPKIPLAFNVIDLESRIWYNQELKSVFFMVPGIIVLLVTIITMLLTAMAIVREREMGTLEQLMVTPLSRAQLIFGKTIPFAILGLFELILAIVVARLIYHIPIAGSLPLFLGLSLLYIFCTLGIGIFISTITHTQQQALFTAWFFLIFCILMSGFFLPIENMPSSVHFLTYINPLRYFMVIVRDLFLKGSGLSDLIKPVGALLVFGIIIMSMAVFRFQKRLD